MGVGEWGEQLPRARMGPRILEPQVGNNSPFLPGFRSAKDSDSLKNKTSLIVSL